MTKKKGRRKKGKRKVQHSGHGKLRRGYYARSDRPGHMSKYKISRDLKRRSKYLPSNDRKKPFEGDDRKVLYNPKNPGQYIILARYDRNKGKWVAVNYQGKATVARKAKAKYKNWKVGYL